MIVFRVAPSSAAPAVQRSPRARAVCPRRFTCSSAASLTCVCAAETAASPEPTSSAASGATCWLNSCSKVLEPDTIRASPRRRHRSTGQAQNSSLCASEKHNASAEAALWRRYIQECTVGFYYTVILFRISFNILVLIKFE